MENIDSLLETIAQNLYLEYKSFGVSKKDIYLYLKSKEHLLTGNSEKDTEILKIDFISDNDNLYKVLDNYINKTFNMQTDYKVQIANINKLSNLINKYKIILNYSMIKKLIDENSLLYLCCKIITENNQDSLIKKGVALVFDNELIINMIEIYCEKEGIDVSSYYDDSKSESLSAIDSYMKEIRKFKLLTPEEEKDLTLRASNGDKAAIKKLAESNLRLVISVAKHFIPKIADNSSISFEDLIQEGNLGLLMAIRKFDPSKGFKFSTYAVYRIKAAIMRSIINKAQSIRIPVNESTLLKKYNRAISDLYEIYGRMPTEREIVRETKLPIEKVRQLKLLSYKELSLNESVSDEEDVELQNFIPDKHDFTSEVDKRNMQLIVQNFINSSKLLDERDKKVLFMHYGIGEYSIHKLTDIAKILGLSNERVRQIEVKALHRLAYEKGIEDFAVYLDNPETALETLIDEKRARGLTLSRSIVAHRIPKPKKTNKSFTFLSLYKYFPEHSKIEVDKVVESLQPNHKEKLKEIYKHNFNADYFVENVSFDDIEIFNKLISLIYKRLKFNSRSHEIRLGIDFLDSEKLKKCDYDYTKLNDEDKKIVTDILLDIKSKLKKYETLKKSKKLDILYYMSDKQYKDLLTLIDCPLFIKLKKLLNFNSAVIILLNLGYLDDKYFSKSLICDLLQITKEVYDSTLNNLKNIYINIWTLINQDNNDINKQKILKED